MPDVNSMLNALRELPKQPPATPSPMPQVTRRARRILRRRHLIVTLGSVLLVAAGATALVGISDDEPDTDVATGPNAATSAADTTPATFLDEVIDLIEENAYFATPELVESWREQAPEVAAGASTTADTYEFVLSMTDALNAEYAGNSLWVPDRAAAYEMVVPTPLEELPAWQVDGNVGYIEMTAIDATQDSDDGRQYVDHVRSGLSTPACGWIVDLRATFHPSTTETMLSAISPLLPVGPALGYRLSDQTETALVVESDGSISATSDGTTATGTGTSLGLPVAVIQSPETSGAYESILLALRGRDGVRTFGQPSGGQTFEVMDSFPLSDGSLLWLTTRLPLDHAGNVVEGPVQPGVTTSQGTEEDPARLAAADWLTQQGTCG